MTGAAAVIVVAFLIGVVVAFILGFRLGRIDHQVREILRNAQDRAYRRHMDETVEMPIVRTRARR